MIYSHLTRQFGSDMKMSKTKLISYLAITSITPIT